MWRLLINGRMLGAVIGGVATTMAFGPAADASAGHPSAFCTAVHAITLDDPFHAALKASDANRFVPGLQAALRSQATPKSAKPSIKILESLYIAMSGGNHSPWTAQITRVSTDANQELSRAVITIWRYYSQVCPASYVASSNGDE